MLVAATFTVNITAQALDGRVSRTRKARVSARRRR
jgi:hypothetical protein